MLRTLAMPRPAPSLARFASLALLACAATPGLLTASPAKEPPRPARVLTAAEAARPLPVTRAPAALPTSANAPPAPLSGCSYTPLVSGVVQSFSAATNLIFTEDVHYWSALGVRSQSGDDWDLSVYGRGGLFPNCLDSLTAGSALGQGIVDVVVGDFNYNPIGTYYATPIKFSALNPCALEWDDDANIVDVNGFGTQRSTGPSDVLECWDVFLYQGVEYTVSLGQTGGTQADLLLFRNPGASPTWQGRGNADLDLAGTQNGVSVNYTAPATGWYGIVVTNENAGVGTYAFRVDRCLLLNPLASGVTVTASQAPSSYAFNQTDHYWSGVAVRPTAGNQDWDMFVYLNQSGGPFPGCFSNLRESSASIVGGVDFVVSDFNYTPTGTYYAEAIPTGLTNTNGTVEWEAGSDVITIDAPPITFAMPASDLIKMWDVYLTGGTTYRLHFSELSTTGGAPPNYNLFLFRNHNGPFPYWSERQFADVATQSIETDYTAPVSAWYGLALVNDGEPVGGEAHIGVFNQGVDVPDGTGPLATRFAAVAPNPARGAARFAFELARAAQVGFEVVDLAGRVVARVPDAPHAAGAASVSWNGRDASAGGAAGGAAAGLRAGIYFVRMSVDGVAVDTRRLVLLP